MIKVNLTKTSFCGNCGSKDRLANTMITSELAEYRFTLCFKCREVLASLLMIDKV